MSFPNDASSIGYHNIWTKRHISVPLSPHIFGDQSGECAPTVAVGGVQLGRYHSYPCTNQMEPSSRLSGALCSHRCLYLSNITILFSSFYFQNASREKMREGFQGNRPGRLLCSMLEHNPEHLLHGQPHAADQALAEHGEQLFYVLPVFHSLLETCCRHGWRTLQALAWSTFHVWPQAGPQKQLSACAPGQSSQMSY